MVTIDELDELIHDCPRLYHMAEPGSWPSIQKLGLLSTTALLDVYGVSGAERTAIESARRSTSVRVEALGLSSAVVRDQLPMTDAGLQRCLTDGLTPKDWYELLNSKVFFWLTRERLLRLMGAHTYRAGRHDVLVLDTRSLVDDHRDRIWLCPMNSGNTKPYPHPRGLSTFQRISDYPYSDWRGKRAAGERVVELCVDNKVRNVEHYVVEVLQNENIESLAGRI